MAVVYCAKNTVNGMKYVGWAKDLEARKERHLHHANEGATWLISRAIRKYGWNAFEWSVLYQDDDSDREWMGWWECRFIKKLGTKMPGGYNMTDGGDGGATRFGAHTTESRKKMSQALKGKTHSEKHRQSMSAALKGRKFTDEQKKRMVEGRRGYKHTEETKRKIAEAHKKENLSAEALARMSAASRGRVVSEETRRKISKANTGKKMPQNAVEKTTAANRGRKATAIARARISASLMGKKHSEERRQRVREGVLRYYASKKAQTPS